MVIMVPALTFSTPAESAGVGNLAFTTPAESAGVGDGLYGYVCQLPIHHYGGRLRPPPQQWSRRLRRRLHCCGIHNGG